MNNKLYTDPTYQRFKKYKKKILITASPNFYVQFIARSLKFDIFFSTKSLDPETQH